MCFGNRERDLLSNHLCIWADGRTFFSSSSLFLLCLSGISSSSWLPANTHVHPPRLRSHLPWPSRMTFQRPLTLEVSRRYLLFSSKAHWWDCLALNEPSLPQQMSSCISCGPVDFIDRSSPGSVGAGAGALSSSWSGHWWLLAPLAALLGALSGAKLSSYPAPLQPRLRTLVRRLLKIDEKNPPVSPQRFALRMAGWFSRLLGKELPGIRSVGLAVLRVCSLEC